MSLGHVFLRLDQHVPGELPIGTKKCGNLLQWSGEYTTTNKFISGKNPYTIGTYISTSK